MSEHDRDAYSVHFARFASKLEKHLLNNGVSCHDADIIIEESSVIFFDKLSRPKKFFTNLFKKQEPLSLFIESSSQAISKYLPEAQKSFGSYDAIQNCLRQS